MADKAVQDLLARLDAVSSRLQRVEAQLGSGAGACPSSSSSSAPSSSSSTGADHAVLVAFDELVENHLKPLQNATNVIGSDRLKSQVGDFVAAVSGLRAVVQVATQSKKPANVGEVPVISAFFETATKVDAAKRVPRKGDDDFNHMSALAEAVAGLQWFLWAKGDPQMDRLPAPVVKEGLDGAVFYLNPLLTKFKAGSPTANEDQIKWVNALKGFFTELQAYVNKNHTQGLYWNPNGGDAKSAVASGGAKPAPASSAGGAPPPPPPGPPPPPVAETSESGAAAAAARNNLFAALNKGDGITSGLKKVTKDMQTHKNPELRATSVVPAAASTSKAPAPRRGAAAAPTKPPVTELQGNKWVVEWHKGNKSIVIGEDAEAKHVLYCYKLDDCVVQVTNPKINAITIDNCRKTAIVFHNVISGVEIVNSNSVEVQAQGVVPNFAVDKCSSITLYVSKDSLNSQFVVSKSDSINVIIPDGDHGDVKELYVPEQFVSSIQNGKLVTTTLEHE